MSDEIETIEVGEEEAEELEPIATDKKSMKISSYGIEIDQHEGGFDLNRVRFLVYGDSGSGKTVFASTWPKAIFLDIDKGMASVVKKVHRIDISSWSQLDDAVRFLSNEKHPFKTVVLDSLNELQYLAMRDTVVNFPTIRRAYDNLPSQSDYGKMLDIAERLVRDVKALNMNAVFISNSTTAEYETDNVQPQLVGKSTAKNLTRMMDVVGYLYKTASGNEGGGNARVMVFDATNFTTKDRSGVLPAKLLNPTYSKLYKAWSTRVKLESKE